MTLNRACAIAGVAESSLGFVPGSTVLTLQAEAAAAALDDAGLTKNDVDGLFCAGRWGRSHLLEIGEYLGIRPSYSDGTVVGGSSFEFYLGHAAAAMKAGLCKVALILYGSTQRSRQERNVNPPGSGLGFQFETPFGLPLPVGVYALAASRHMALHGTTRRQLAEVAVAARQWAALNPKAYKREPLTFRTGAVGRDDLRAAGTAGLLSGHGWWWCRGRPCIPIWPRISGKSLYGCSAKVSANRIISFLKCPILPGHLRPMQVDALSPWQVSNTPTSMSRRSTTRSPLPSCLPLRLSAFVVGAKAEPSSPMAGHGQVELSR